MKLSETTKTFFLRQVLLTKHRFSNICAHLGFDFALSLPILVKYYVPLYGQHLREAGLSALSLHQRIPLVNTSTRNVRRDNGQANAGMGKKSDGAVHDRVKTTNGLHYEQERATKRPRQGNTKPQDTSDIHLGRGDAMQGEPDTQRQPCEGSSQYSASISLDGLDSLERQLSQFMDPSFQCFEPMMGTETDPGFAFTFDSYGLTS